MSKRWTEKDDTYLQERWGTTAIPRLAEKLGRTERAVTTRAWILGLGPYLEAGGYVTLSALLRAIGHEKCTIGINGWIKRGLPVRHKQVKNNRVMVVYLDDFWEWADKNRSRIDFSRFEPLAIGKEPDWVPAQRKIDAARRNAYKRWSVHEDLKMRAMIESGADYDEIAKALHRSMHAVDYRCRELGLKPKKGPYVRIVWNDEEKEILRNGIRNGESLEIIADRLGRSTSMVVGFTYMTYGTTRLDRIRAMI